MEERRIFQRFDSRLPIKIKDARDDYDVSLSFCDASAQGARVISKERFYVNDNIALDVKIPGTPRPVFLKGRVVWAQKKEDDRWDTGVQFHDVPLVKMSLLYEAVS